MSSSLQRRPKCATDNSKSKEMFCTRFVIHLSQVCDKMGHFLMHDLTYCISSFYNNFCITKIVKLLRVYRKINKLVRLTYLQKNAAACFPWYSNNIFIIKQWFHLNTFLMMMVCLPNASHVRKLNFNHPILLFVSGISPKCFLENILNLKYWCNALKC